MVNIPGETVVAIGVFDGVHRGHQLILARARAHAAQLGLPVVAVTFDPHPMSVTRPGRNPKLLQTIDDRVAALASLGADAVNVVEFTADFAALTPEEFVDQVLVTGLNARYVVVGDNFRFGQRAAGDPLALEEFGKSRGFDVEAVPLATEGDEPWSSTYIRGLLVAGDIARATEALGRPFRLEGTVVHGNHRGRELGFPTANVDVAPHLVLPGPGVYAAWFGYAGTRRMAAVSVGTNPQFEGAEMRVESYVLDSPGLDLYGQEVSVDFVARIRGQWVFPSVADLIARIEQDVAEVRLALAAS
ncbi:MAG: bifunctional riboflavin kinase/FAD synthetase [Actinobacteria bacterium]|nr:bifunctional riboflavin kinase/FAD synthetase [Actinomycetota bacterium]